MRKVVLALSMVLLAATAFAAPSPVTVNTNIVRAQVNGSCLVPAAFDLNFGAYDPIDTNATAALDGSTTWLVRCTKNLVVTVSFNDGLHSTGALVRRMQGTSAGEFLTYQLYKNAARTFVWGTGADDLASGTGLDFTAVGVAGNTLNIYGRIPPGQDVAVENGTDQYEDTITATLNF